MEIQMGISVSDTSLSTANSMIVYELSKSINDYFISKDYGKDILKITISFLMVFSKEGYEDWYKEKKPQYIEYKKSKSKLTGETIEIKKTFFYEIKFSDELLQKYIELNDEVSEKIIATTVLNSLGKLDMLDKKVSDFNKEQFKEDLEEFFRKRGLI